MLVGHPDAAQRVSAHLRGDGHPERVCVRVAVCDAIGGSCDNARCERRSIGHAGGFSGRWDLVHSPSR